ncbi:recombination mediator RecR [Anaeromyxobacter dehalogenans]|uniref:Recombination protein RecR n=1 Tax=Anaeromyxobacter dehalogenans (strain 2CP-C) TaxID=290397 RepID=RECR_ANADE|nr:recombination mediator RecR [Anaeromyxobacter dehalogenans]Q2IFP4.1 RecName: Full=Recombination protein RecR [Anaeromyxobacter dehalogenans 2CP-C]ABC83401.1 recombination protein RecR [Anaeromyxobacter dehalogenans 2CP-C]
MAVADPIARLVKELAKLPGIGEKTAQRLAFHILKAGAGYAGDLAAAIAGVVRDVRLCSTCQTLTDQDPCAICRDPERDARMICVVEGVPDLLAVERTHEFRGRYHVLHGALSPLDGVGPSDLKIRELLVRLEREPADEIVVATNPDVEGEATALYLTKLLKPMGLKVTRIAQGVPMGGDLEYADQVTLARALAGRREL